MSKWIDDLNKSYINRVKKRFKKLNEELEKLAHPENTKMDIDDLNDAIKLLEAEREEK